MAILRIIDGHGAGAVYELDSQRMTIGRDPTNVVQLSDPKSSRFHAEITADNGNYLLVDLASSNGTWNDHGRITREPLIPGGVFRIGATYMRLEEAPSDGAAATMAGAAAPWPDPDQIEGLPGNRSELFQRQRGSDSRALERTNSYLVLLHQMVLRANDAVTRDGLFELLDDAAADVLEGDRCAVFLPTPDGWTLWPAHERRLRARFGATPFARTLLTTVRTRGEPLLCTSGAGTGRSDIDPTSSMVQAGVRSAMAAPLRIGEEIHALLYVDRLNDQAGFTRSDLEFLAAVANQLAVMLHNRLHVAQLTAEVERLQAEPRTTIVDLIGHDPAMTAIDETITKAAPTDVAVLILGESGTGKEQAARVIHQRSRRRDLPLQMINCTALGEEAMEAALFGLGGGGPQGRPGLFELADHGTLFLDEVGELALPVQARLVDVLERGEVHRLGDTSVKKVDVRVLAASNRDLGEEVSAGRFREDLLHRLGVLTIAIPPLRERPTDIDLLADHFLRDGAQRQGHPAKRLSAEARSLLLRHDWPGNVRQLRTTLERLSILVSDKVIQAADLPDSIKGSETKAFTTPLVSLETVERAHILRILDHCGGNKKATAELLGIDRSTLYAKLRQYGMA